MGLACVRSDIRAERGVESTYDAVKHTHPAPTKAHAPCANNRVRWCAVAFGVGAAPACARRGLTHTRARSRDTANRLIRISLTPPPLRCAREGPQRARARNPCKTRQHPDCLRDVMGAPTRTAAHRWWRRVVTYPSRRTQSCSGQRDRPGCCPWAVLAFYLEPLAMRNRA